MGVGEALAPQSGNTYEEVLCGTGRLWDQRLEDINREDDLGIDSVFVIVVVVIVMEVVACGVGRGRGRQRNEGEEQARRDSAGRAAS